MNRSRLVFGPVFLAVGGLLLAEQAGAVDAWSVLGTWWPTVVLLSGTVQLLSRPRNVVGGVTVLVIGAALLLFTLNVVDTLALLWPLLLIGLGAWLLIGRTTSSRARIEGGEATDLMAVFDDRHVRVPAGPYGGGAVTTVFGDMQLDLSAATDDQIALQVTTVFGDVEVTVPPGWEVEVSGPELFGDVRVPEPPAPRRDGSRPGVLRLRIVLVFGDVTVRAARREVPVASNV